MNLLTVENLTVTLATGSGDAQAVRNLSFNVGHGEILGVAGESGSGKTMTALSMLGLLPYNDLSRSHDIASPDANCRSSTNRAPSPSPQSK